MMVTGKLVRCTVSVSNNGETELSTKEDSLTEEKMERVYSPGQMETNILVVTRKILEMDSEHSFGKPPTLNSYSNFFRNTNQKYEGYWKAGVQHGIGKMTSKSGTIKEGKWENGQNVEWFSKVSQDAL